MPAFARLPWLGMTALWLSACLTETAAPTGKQQDSVPALPGGESLETFLANPPAADCDFGGGSNDESSFQGEPAGSLADFLLDAKRAAESPRPRNKECHKAMLAEVSWVPGGGASGGYYSVIKEWVSATYFSFSGGGQPVDASAKAFFLDLQQFFHPENLLEWMSAFIGTGRIPVGEGSQEAAKVGYTNDYLRKVKQGGNRIIFVLEDQQKVNVNDCPEESPYFKMDGPFKEALVRYIAKKLSEEQ